MKFIVVSLNLLSFHRITSKIIESSSNYVIEVIAQRDPTYHFTQRDIYTDYTNISPFEIYVLSMISFYYYATVTYHIASYPQAYLKSKIVSIYLKENLTALIEVL